MRYWLLILVFAACLFSCKNSSSKKVIDPEAIRLNNAAITSLGKSADVNKGLLAAIDTLNQAIKTDDKYLQAYYNKFTFQKQLKRFSDAVATGKQMVGLAPNNAE